MRCLCNLLIFSIFSASFENDTFFPVCFSCTGLLLVVDVSCFVIDLVLTLEMLDLFKIFVSDKLERLDKLELLLEMLLVWLISCTCSYKQTSSVSSWRRFCKSTSSLLSSSLNIRLFTCNINKFKISKSKK